VISGVALKRDENIRDNDGDVKNLSTASRKLTWIFLFIKHLFLSKLIDSAHACRLGRARRGRSDSRDKQRYGGGAKLGMARPSGVSVENCCDALRFVLSVHWNDISGI